MLETLLGQEVRLEDAPTFLDRHGRVSAILWLMNGESVQARLVAAGEAALAPVPEVDAGTLQHLLWLEQEARTARRGLWGRGELPILDAARVDAPPMAFVLVEGLVLDVTAAQSFVYVNFGADWRTDFSVRALKADAKAFAKAGLDLAALEGRRVRIRGRVLAANGPMIEVFHPAQIEVLE